MEAVTNIDMKVALLSGNIFKLQNQDHSKVIYYKFGEALPFYSVGFCRTECTFGPSGELVEEVVTDLLTVYLKKIKLKKSEGYFYFENKNNAILSALFKADEKFAKKNQTGFKKSIGVCKPKSTRVKEEKQEEVTKREIDLSDLRLQTTPDFSGMKEKPGFLSILKTWLKKL